MFSSGFLRFLCVFVLRLILFKGFWACHMFFFVFLVSEAVLIHFLVWCFLFLQEFSLGFSYRAVLHVSKVF